MKAKKNGQPRKEGDSTASTEPERPRFLLVKWHIPKNLSQGQLKSEIG